MTTYAKYADMYRQRVARSQDHRLELSQRISPVRNTQTSARLVNQNVQPQGGFQTHTIPSPRSSNGTFTKNQRGTGMAAGVGAEIPAHLKMTGDRAAYMTFLEVQLERVTSACNNALSFQEKVEALQASSTAQDEKMQNVSRLVKLLQSFSEAQEEDLQTLKHRVQLLGQRYEDVAVQLQRQGGSAPGLRQQDSVAESGVGFGGVIDTKHGSSMSPARRSAHKRSLSKSRSPANRSERKAQGTIGDRVTILESMINNMNSQVVNNFNSNLLHSNSFGTLEPQKMPGVAQLKEDLMNFAQEVDKQMRDVESRVVSNLSQHFEEQNINTNNKIDEALLLLDQKVTKLQQVTSPAFARPNLIQSTQIVEDGRINPAKMEEALNDWLSKVEEQVNQIEEQVNTRAAQIDLKSLEHRVLDMHEEREIRFSQLEQYCQRMCEQGQTRYNEMKEISLDWEDRFLQIQRQVETTLDEQSKSITPDEGRGSLLQSGLTSHIGGTDLSQLRTIEKKLARRLSEGVDRLGTIIKDMAKAQRKLETRTNGLEVKVFGKSKTSNPAADAAKKKVVHRPTPTDYGPPFVGSIVQTGQVSARRNSIQNSGLKKSAKASRNQQTGASPKPQMGSSRRRSQKTFSPPVKDASQGAEKRSMSSKHRRSRSKSSMRPRSASGMPILENERHNSVSARQPQPKGSLNNFRTSFEQRLLQDNGANDGEISPREILRRARDRSIRELSHSLNESRSRSPHSNHRLQNLVELEQASPHHHRLSQSISKMDNHGSVLPHQNVSILNGPVTGQKNIIASNTISSSMDQFQQRLNSGRDFNSVPMNDISRTSDRIPKRQRINESNVTTENKRNSGTRKVAKAQQRRASRSASRERSREHAYTLQELERREKSLKKKLAAKNDESGKKRTGSSATRNNAQRSFKTQQPASSKERSLSQRTFQRMNAIGHNTLLAAQKGSNMGSLPSPGYQSNNQSFQQQQTKARTRRTDRGGTDRAQISPNRVQGPLKTTKSATGNISQEIKVRKRSESARRSGSRGRSRSAHHQHTETSAERPRPNMAAPTSFRANKTAAHEIFHQPLEYHTYSQQNLETVGDNNISRRSDNNGTSSNDALTHKKKHARKRSISIDQSMEEKKSDQMTRKKSTSQAKQATPGSSKKGVNKTETAIGGAASKTAKQKLKNLQNKKSNQRLARLEKMYQELTEIEAKTTAGMI